MINVIEKLRRATAHNEEPLSLTWKSWSPVLKGKYPASRVNGDLKTYLTKCLFAGPLNITFDLYSEPKLKEFIKNDEFFALAAKGGYFIIGNRDGDFVCVSSADGSVALIPGWSITEGQFTKERKYKSLTTFLRGEIRRAKQAMAEERKGERLQKEFETASKSDADALDEYGLSKYHRALMSGDRDAVQNELNRGATLESRTRDGNHPLLLAKNLEVLQLLLERGCDPNAEAKLGDSRNFTIMHKVALHYPLDFVRALHEAGADLDRPVGPYDETPIQLALQHGKADVVDYFLEHGIDPMDYAEHALALPAARPCLPIFAKHGVDLNAD
jgi:hypothetical protein